MKKLSLVLVLLLACSMVQAKGRKPMTEYSQIRYATNPRAIHVAPRNVNTWGDLTEVTYRGSGGSGCILTTDNGSGAYESELVVVDTAPFAIPGGSTLIGIEVEVGFGVDPLGANNPTITITQKVSNSTGIGRTDVTAAAHWAYPPPEYLIYRFCGAWDTLDILGLTGLTIAQLNAGDLTYTVHVESNVSGPDVYIKFIRFVAYYTGGESDNKKGWRAAAPYRSTGVR